MVYYSSPAYLVSVIVCTMKDYSTETSTTGKRLQRVRTAFGIGLFALLLISPAACLDEEKADGSSGISDTADVFEVPDGAEVDAPYRAKRSPFLLSQRLTWILKLIW